MTHVVYVLECADGSYYTGYTTDVERRVREHNEGDGAKYTRGRAPVSLVHVECYDSQSAAMAREYEIKQFSRPQKERLVEESEASSLAESDTPGAAESDTPGAADNDTPALDE